MSNSDIFAQIKPGDQLDANDCLYTVQASESQVSWLLIRQRDKKRVRLLKLWDFKGLYLRFEGANGYVTTREVKRISIVKNAGT